MVLQGLPNRGDLGVHLRTARVGNRMLGRNDLIFFMDDPKINAINKLEI